MDDDTKKWIIAIVVIVGLIFGVKLLISAANHGLISNPIYDDSTLTIKVESTHILFDADYDLYIDGELVKEWRMSPNNYLQTTYNYRTLITEDSRYIEVKVISTGGGTGAQVDSVKVLVGTGADYNITLRA